MCANEFVRIASKARTGADVIIFMEFIDGISNAVSWQAVFRHHEESDAVEYTGTGCSSFPVPMTSAFVKFEWGAIALLRPPTTEPVRGFLHLGYVIL